MTTYGPDLNLSCAELDPSDLVDVGRKLTHYSPWLVPLSFSSPFRDGDRLGRALGAHRDPHRSPAGRAGVPRRRPAAGRCRPVADPGGPDPGRGGPHRVQGVRRLPGPDALRRAAQPAHRPGPGPTRWPGRRDHPGRGRAPARGPGRAGRRRRARRTGELLAAASRRARRPRRRPGPAGRLAGALGAPRVPGGGDAGRVPRGQAVAGLSRARECCAVLEHGAALTRGQV